MRMIPAEARSGAKNNSSVRGRQRVNRCRIMGSKKKCAVADEWHHDANRRGWQRQAPSGIGKLRPEGRIGKETTAGLADFPCSMPTSPSQCSYPHYLRQVTRPAKLVFRQTEVSIACRSRNAVSG